METYHAKRKCDQCGKETFHRIDASLGGYKRTCQECQKTIEKDFSETDPIINRTLVVSLIIVVVVFAIAMLWLME